MVRQKVEIEVPDEPKKAPAKTKPRAQEKNGGPQAAAMARFAQRFGKQLGDEHFVHGLDVSYDLPTISTGSLLLDYRLNTGGFPVGRSIELWGNPGTCKTTTLLLAMAAAQRMFPDRYVAFVDVEGSFDRRWAEAHGIRMDQLKLVKRLKYAEEWCDAVFEITTSDLFSMVGMDSIGALIPKEEFTKKADEPTVGTKAKLVTRLVHQVSAHIRETDMCAVYVNQVRAVVGPMGGSTTGGGFGLKHVSSIQAMHRDGAPKTIRVEGHDVPVGKEVAIKAEKNKLGPPKMVARPIFYQQATEKFGPVGIDQAAEAFQLGKLLGLFERQGNFYILPSGAKYLGEEQTTTYLRETPEEVSEVRRLALESVAGNLHDDLPELKATEDALDLDKVAAESLVVDAPAGAA